MKRSARTCWVWTRAPRLSDSAARPGTATPWGRTPGRKATPGERTPVGTNSPEEIHSPVGRPLREERTPVGKPTRAEAPSQKGPLWGKLFRARELLQPLAFQYLAHVQIPAGINPDGMWTPELARRIAALA